MSTDSAESARFRKLYGRAPLVNWSKCLAVEPKAEISGPWRFKGTRVPVHALFEQLEGGATLAEFTEHFPGVTRQHVNNVLEFLLYSLEQPQKRGPAAGSRKRKPKLPAQVRDLLRFISQNMKLSGFSGRISAETKAHALRLYRQGKLRRKTPWFSRAAIRAMRKRIGPAAAEK